MKIVVRIELDGQSHRLLLKSTNTLKDLTKAIHNHFFVKKGLPHTNLNLQFNGTYLRSSQNEQTLLSLGIGMNSEGSDLLGLQEPVYVTAIRPESSNSSSAMVAESKKNPVQASAVEDVMNAVNDHDQYTPAYNNYTLISQLSSSKPELKQISNALKSYSTLDLSAMDMSTSITASEVGHLAIALKTNSTVRKLDLSFQPLDKIALATLSIVLIQNSTLTHMNLAYSGICTQTTYPLNTRFFGLDCLAQSLNLNRTLTSINLAGNNITDEGIAILIPGLEYNSTLTSINLENNQITDKGKEMLQQVAKKHPGLTIYLDNNLITEETLQQGQQASIEALPKFAAGSFVNNKRKAEVHDQKATVNADDDMHKFSKFAPFFTRSKQTVQEQEQVQEEQDSARPDSPQSKG